MKKKLFIILLTLMPLAVFAKPVVSIEADASVIGENETLNLTVTIEGTARIRSLKLLGAEQFTILSQNQSTSISSFNMRSSVTVQYNYVLMPKGKGNFNLKALVKTAVHSVWSDTLNIQVKKGSGKNSKSRDEVFVEVHLSDKEIYTGQKFVLTYEVYSHYRLERLRMIDEFKLDNFLSTTLKKQERRPKLVMLDGKRYAKYVIQQNILLPVKTGKIIIPGFRLQANVVLNSRGMRGTVRPVYLSAPEQTITVKPLPAAGQPKDFKNLVGELELDHKLSSTQGKQGEPITLKLTISGSASLDGLDKIFPNGVDDIQVYEMEKSKTETSLNNKYYSEKNIDVVLIPQKSGKLKIPDIKIPYFDTNKKAYRYLRVPETEIEVEKSTAQQSIGQSGKENIVTLEREEIQESSEPGALIIKLPWPIFWSMLGLGVLVVLFVLAKKQGWFQKSKKIPGNKLLDNIHENASAQELKEILSQILENQFQINLKTQSWEAIEASLPLSSGQKKELDFLLQELEGARYAPHHGSGDFVGRSRKIAGELLENK